MKSVKVNSSKNYEVKIGSGILKDAGKYISEVFTGKNAVIVSDDNVYPLYGDKLKKSLSDAGINTIEFVFPHGEKSKCLSTYGQLLNMMCDNKMTRSDAVIALGGGVVGDLSGFAAATYQRGIAFIQIPTTLLADVDSSVGGKTGIDLENSKNQVGAFYQPLLVLCDTDTLKTLPETEYRNGCAEVIKYAMIGSRELFDSISETPVKNQYEQVIYQCVSMKSDFVEKDEFDLGLRMMLNFGHTIGHTVEARSHYAVPHGQGVAMGMAAITRAAYAFSLCDKNTLDLLIELIKKYGLPTEIDYPKEELLGAAMTDKKSSGDSLRLVVPEKVGACSIKKIQKSEFIEWLSAGGIR
ncbi:MAG: 3-dehydroquinate synthase [Acutalibacteraceae bacterium]